MKKIQTKNGFTLFQRVSTAGVPASYEIRNASDEVVYSVNGQHSHGLSTMKSVLESISSVQVWFRKVRAPEKRKNPFGKATWLKKYTSPIGFIRDDEGMISEEFGLIEDHPEIEIQKDHPYFMFMKIGEIKKFRPDSALAANQAKAAE